jgi:hypothetical protein
MFYQKNWIALSALVGALGSIHQVLAFISISQIFSTAFFGTLSYLAAFGLGALLIAGISG